MPSFSLLLGKAWGPPFDSETRLPRDLNQEVRLTRKGKPVLVRNCRNFYSLSEESRMGRIGSTFSVSSSISTYGSDHSSRYSSDSINTLPSPHLNNLIFKRTRAKTPVFAVGQLEASSSHHPIAIDVAAVLAEEYQALLPPRVETPLFERKPPKLRIEVLSAEPTPPKVSRKPLRKIKAEQDLHQLTRKQSRSASFSDSESETLLGSEPTSPLSPKSLFVDFKKQAILEQTGEEPHVIYETEDDLPLDHDTDVALSICMDLLANKLASSMSEQHPLEDVSRCSTLQILFMIEAYESFQRYVRQKLNHPHVMGEWKSHGRDVDRILKYWLQVLYSVYDLAF